MQKIVLGVVRAGFKTDIAHRFWAKNDVGGGAGKLPKPKLLVYFIQKVVLGVVWAGFQN